MSSKSSRPPPDPLRSLCREETQFTLEINGEMNKDKVERFLQRGWHLFSTGESSEFRDAKCSKLTVFHILLLIEIIPYQDQVMFDLSEIETVVSCPTIKADYPLWFLIPEIRGWKSGINWNSGCQRVDNIYGEFHPGVEGDGCSVKQNHFLTLKMTTIIRQQPMKTVMSRSFSIKLSRKHSLRRRFPKGAVTLAIQTLLYSSCSSTGQYGLQSHYHHMNLDFSTAAYVTLRRLFTWHSLITVSRWEHVEQLYSFFGSCWIVFDWHSPPTPCHR